MLSHLKYDLTSGDSSYQKTTMRLQTDALICFVLSSIAIGAVYGRILAEQPFLTIQTENGQVYDCIDFYKQPAFSHPLLKQHIYQVVRPNSSASAERGFKGLGLKDGGCPHGTVPILRGTMIRDPPPTLPPKAEVHCYAVVRTILDNTSKKFYGSNASPTLHKPRAQGYQWSSTRIKLSNGPDSIEAGWMVFPDLFKDNEAHLYTRFKTGSLECFNVECPGFVQTASDVPLGTIPANYSIVGGQQYTWNISIEKHPDDGNWWVSMTGDYKFPIGFWPKSLFTSLADVATQVEWGGEVNNPGPASPGPAMGNSLQASYDAKWSANFQQVTVVDESSHIIVDPSRTEKFFDCPKLYTVLDYGYRGDYWGRLIFYGGSQPAH